MLLIECLCKSAIVKAGWILLQNWIAIINSKFRPLNQLVRLLVWPYRSLIVIGVTSIFFSCAAQAAGTAAGVVVSNVVTLTFSAGTGVPSSSIVSSPAVFTVDELIDVTLTWQDVAAISVNSPGVNDVLTFLLTNTGNGQEAFSLVRNNAVSGDAYDPVDGSAGAIFIESGLAPGFQASGPNADLLYISGSNDPTLNADAQKVIYLVSNTPSGQANGSVGNVQLTAAALTPNIAGKTPGFGVAGAGQGGTTAVTGIHQAQAQSTGSYKVGGLVVNLIKTVAQVQDPKGCIAAPPSCQVVPGSILTYNLVVTVVGSGSASALMVTDPMPPQVAFVPGSINVDGVVKTDANDGDNADFGLTAPNALSVNLGNVMVTSSTPRTFAISFRAVVN